MEKVTVLRGSIFAETSDEVNKKVHWKRRLVIRFYPLALLLTDIFLIIALCSLAIHLHPQADLVSSLSLNCQVVLAVMLSSIFGVYLVDGYNYAKNKRNLSFIAEHLIVSIGVAVVVFCLIYSIVIYGDANQSSRLTVGMVLVIFPLVSIFYRFWLFRLQMHFERGNAMCIIGAGERGRDLYRRLKTQEISHEFIVASFRPERVGQRLIEGDTDAPVVQPIDIVTFQSSIQGKFIKQYIVATDADRLPDAFKRRMVSALFHHHKIETYESYFTNILRMEPPEQWTVNWLMLDSFRLNHSVSYNRLKRLMDICAALIGLVLAGPLLIGIAIAVKLTSKGPILFKQERIGFREKPFVMLKFRSMRVGSEKGGKYTSVNDERFTPIGKFIRKMRLDELPQFWNVLVGDLSLIGPRAVWVELAKEYERCLPLYHLRHVVKPGITGWAQVNYSYGASNEDALEKLNYDLYYVHHYSLSLDITIIIKTFYTILFSKGL